MAVRKPKETKLLCKELQVKAGASPQLKEVY